MAAYCSEENCGCGEASKLGSARRDLGLDSSIVVASSTAWLETLLAWQDGEVATSVGVPATKLSGAVSSIARLEGGGERDGLIATETGKYRRRTMHIDTGLTTP